LLVGIDILFLTSVLVSSFEKTNISDLEAISGAIFSKRFNRQGFLVSIVVFYSHWTTTTKSKGHQRNFSHEPAVWTWENFNATFKQATC
jgi:hypothetical protein